MCSECPKFGGHSKTMGLVIDPETNLYLKQLIEKGKKEGVLEAKKEDARRLYFKLNLSPEQIAEILNVPLDLVKEAIEENKD